MINFPSIPVLPFMGTTAVLQKPPVSYTPSQMGLPILGKNTDYNDLILSDSPVCYFPLTEAEMPFKDLAGIREATEYGSGDTILTSHRLLPDNSGAAYYSGASRRQVRVNSPLHLSGDISVEAWVYYDGPNTESYGQVVSEGLSINGWNLFRTGSGNWGWILRTVGNSWGDNYLDSGVSTSAAWTHLVGTYSASTGSIHLYINGVDHSASSPAANVDYGIDDIGMVFGGKGDPVGNRLGGNVSRIAIYNSVLDSTKVASHYSVGTSVITEDIYSAFTNASVSDGTAYSIRKYKTVPIDSSLIYLGTVS